MLELTQRTSIRYCICVHGLMYIGCTRLYFKFPPWCLSPMVGSVFVYSCENLNPDFDGECKRCNHNGNHSGTPVRYVIITAAVAIITAEVANHNVS